MNPNIRLKVVLMEKGISQRELSFATKIPEDQISTAIRHGKSTPQMRKKICRFLKMTESEVFESDQ
jgi:DNA-binding Xre family transcriptional regulator